MAYIRISWKDKSATSSCVPNSFYFVWWSRMAGSSAQTYEKWSLFSLFSRLGPFDQVFGQVKGWLMLKLKNFVLLPRLRESSVQSYKKLSFFIVVSRLGPFPQDFGQVKGWVMLTLYKIKDVSHVVACQFVFTLFH